LNRVNSGNEENNTNTMISQNQNNNDNNNNNNDDDENVKVDNENKLIRISEHENPKDESQKIINEETIKDENNKRENDESPGIYDQANNTNSPKFSTNANFKESIIINNNEPKSDINSFYQKYKKRDDDFKGKEENYKAIELPSKFNDDKSDKINKEVNTKFDFGNIDLQAVDGLCKQFPKKVEEYDDDKKYENDIYKALGLDKVLEGYNDYKRRYLENDKSNSDNNISRNKNNITGINNTTTNYNNNISKNRGKIGDSRTKNYMLESSLSLIGHNMELDQNPYLRNSEI
jgi:hypothetical protein